MKSERNLGTIPLMSCLLLAARVFFSNKSKAWKTYETLWKISIFENGHIAPFYTLWNSLKLWELLDYLSIALSY
jgi:hypothetical protein